MANLEGLGEFPRRIPKVPEVKRLRGASEGDEETVTTALPRDDESPHNVDDKVADFFGKKESSNDHIFGEDIHPGLLLYRYYR